MEFNFHKWFRLKEKTVAGIEDAKNDPQFEAVAENRKYHKNVAAYEQYERGTRKPLIEIKKNKK
ncbi:MAG: hypothetical protein UR23_C0010G0011 [Candidatus Roizmanbacteria bacterium GW2011_GWA2_32_13]|uniref:Uncharacterized protein n=1 Tax=Candidatus Roizmanbacteria bacterium GW2011_GWA2_32_13 TaxID=1618475 RepID=A0A0G0C112_9BACT|nr:MAG: hypothetical protein UR23_C0010G0011 [Candidatus Roizmanbacteria bacterium GW2011_GWA2_32_13]